MVKYLGSLQHASSGAVQRVVVFLRKGDQALLCGLVI